MVLITCCRFPEVAAKCKDLPRKLPFKYFNLVMSATGVCKMHRDRRDVLSVVLCLRRPAAGGHLVLESGDTFLMHSGDFCIIPGAFIGHGNRYLLLLC